METMYHPTYAPFTCQPLLELQKHQKALRHTVTQLLGHSLYLVTYYRGVLGSVHCPYPGSFCLPLHHVCYPSKVPETG